MGFLGTANADLATCQHPTCALTPNSYSDPSRQTPEKLLHVGCWAHWHRISTLQTRRRWQNGKGLIWHSPHCHYSVYLNHFLKSKSSDSGKDGVSTPQTASIFCWVHPKPLDKTQKAIGWGLWRVKSRWWTMEKVTKWGRGFPLSPFSLSCPEHEPQ